MLTPGRHYVNAPLRLTVRLQDSQGNDFDPDTVTLTVMDSWGSKTDYVYGTDSVMTRLSRGEYAGDITPDKGGRWYFRWATTGDVVAEEGNFLVQVSPFFDDYPPLGYSGYCRP